MQTQKQLAAIALLGDLLDSAMPQAPKYKAPVWKPTALTIIYRETHCQNCGKVHVSPNPLLLLTEQNSRTQAVRKSASPVSVPKNLSDLPISTENLVFTPTRFCTDCVHELCDDKLRQLFINQVGDKHNEALLEEDLDKLSDLLNPTKEC